MKTNASGRCRSSGTTSPIAIPAAKKIRKKIRSRSRVSTWARSSVPCSRRPLKISAEIPTSAIAIVASRNGAPMIAPIATSSAPSAPPTMATIGIRVSGIAVPTAASTLPVAPSPTPSLLPVHSIALVNSNAPARITANAAASSTYSIDRLYPLPSAPRRRRRRSRGSRRGRAVGHPRTSSTRRRE